MDVGKEIYDKFNQIMKNYQNYDDALFGSFALIINQYLLKKCKDDNIDIEIMCKNFSEIILKGTLKLNQLRNPVN